MLGCQRAHEKILSLPHTYDVSIVVVTMDRTDQGATNATICEMCQSLTIDEAKSTYTSVLDRSALIMALARSLTHLGSHHLLKAASIEVDDWAVARIHASAD